MGVHDPAEPKLLEMIETDGLARPAFGLSERREKHAGEKGDNGNHDQQLDQCEPGRLPLLSLFLR
jgi:hypothetical protein